MKRLLRQPLLAQLTGATKEGTWRSLSNSTAAQTGAGRTPTYKYLIMSAGVGVTFLAVKNWTSMETEKMQLAWLMPTRLARDVATAASIVLDYKWTLSRAVEGDEKEQVLKECHQRSADRLLQLCFANGGVYTKLGQHLGQLLLQDVMQKKRSQPDKAICVIHLGCMPPFTARCPVSPITEVRHIIAHDLGAAPEKLFKHFNPNPIASASLAQVHVAEDHEGRKLAVKVQHSGLRESAAADIMTVELLVKAAKIVFPDFDYQWLVDEIKNNLPLELDFTHEAANAERCRANLDGPRSNLKGRVHIPHVYHDLTSPRVLTMEFIDGASVTDLAALHRQRVSPAALSRLISETFNEMIFIHGDVHADPHAANLLVRRKGGKMQLVLLDHGLYRRIDDEFRLEYAGLWRALVFGDEPGIRKHCVAMRAGDMVPLFAGMLTQRPWEEVTNGSDLAHLTVPTTKENKEMVQKYAQQYMREIAELLVRVPRELLLLLKTNDCLRSVDNILGQPVNNVLVTARECTRAISEHEAQQAKGVWNQLRARVSGAWEVAQLETRLSVLQLVTWWTWLKSCMTRVPAQQAETDG